MNILKPMASAVILAVLASKSPAPTFVTCYPCVQVYDKPCATSPTSPFTDVQCGSEDWYTPFGCKDFYIRTYTCVSGATYRTTVEVWHAGWNCDPASTAAGSACY